MPYVQKYRHLQEDAGKEVTTKTKRIINVSVLPGEPLDGSGKVCVHLFVQDECGPFVEPMVLHIVDNQLVSKPTRGRLACDPKRTVAPVMRGGVTYITMRSDDPRGVTCHKCLASKEYTDKMKQLTPA